MTTNPTSATAPTVKGTQTRGSFHPAPDTSMRPKTSAARPVVAASAPAGSRRPAEGFRVSGTFRRAIASTAPAIGRFRKNTALQDATCTSHPPATGPIAPATAVSDDHVPTARPRSRAEKAAPRIARLDGTTSAAPTPCTARARTSAPTSGANAQAAEDAANTATPIVKTRRRPKRSADENECGEEERVGLDDPLNVRNGGFQALLEHRQRNVDHRPVDEGHARAENRGREDPLRRRACARRGLGRLEDHLVARAPCRNAHREPTQLDDRRARTTTE